MCARSKELLGRNHERINHQYTEPSLKKKLEAFCVRNSRPMDASKSETKYERLRKIGIGSYGVVFKCVNRQTGQIVAIKRYSENDTDPIIRKIAMREVRMLRQLRHPNLIHLIEVFRRKRILHLVFEYCELTVLDVIEKYANNCPLNLIRKIIWQLVNGVSHCHAHNCIHRDIKPENILINQAGVVKLCDFGFARSMTSSASIAGRNPIGARQVKYEREAQLIGVSTNQLSRFMLSTGESNERRSDNRHQHHHQQQQMFESNKENQQSERLALTEYVATRWYRAPELLVGDVYYDKKIDIWAIGCVTAELMRGEPIWPGKTDLDQLFIIKNSLGPLTTAQTHTLITQALYDQASLERLLDRTNVTDPLERKLPQRVGQAGIEFVLECLQMDPSKRPTCDELLQHQYIQSAQMTQFVRGVSHATRPLVNNHSETMALTQRNSNKGGQSFLAESGQQSRTNGDRSNSQAILMMANSSTQQPANKRLLVASENVADCSSSNQQNPKQKSLVPVRVRACQVEANASQTGAWSHAEGCLREQNSNQAHKRKIPQATTDRSAASDQKLSRSEQKRQTRRDKKPPVTSYRGSTLLKTSARRLAESNDNLYRLSGCRDEKLAIHGEALSSLNGVHKGGFVDSQSALSGSSDSREQLCRSSEITSYDREQTILASQTLKKNYNSMKDKAIYRTEHPTFRNTNSSASSSSPRSFGTNRSSSNSFLPSVQC